PGAGAGDDNLPFARIIDRPELRGIPRQANAHVLGDRADPDELADIVTWVARSDQRLENGSVGKRHQHRTVTRRRIGNVVSRAGPASARHVLTRDGRIAGNVPTNMATEQSRIEIDAAACRAGDNNRYRPVDSLGGLRPDGA